MDADSKDAIRSAATDFFQRSASVQRARRLLERDADSAHCWPALVEMGWTGILAPESAGGLALDLEGAAEILRAAGEHAAPEPLLAVAVLSTALLAQIATPAAQSLLRSVVTGEGLPAVAWQENSGELSAVPLSCGCEARANGQVVLQGEKIAVMPGARATGWVVSARDAIDTWLLWVPRGTTGVSETLHTLVDGSDAACLRFEQVELAADAVLARGEQALHALRHALAVTQLLQSAELLGAGQALLALTRQYLCTRTQFGQPIGVFQALQHRCVDMFIHLTLAQATLAEALVFQATATLSIERLEALASRVNARCSAAALQASRSAVQLHGAMGYTQECDVSLHYLRVLKLSAWLGNVTAHQLRYARQGALSQEATEAGVDVPWQGDFPRTANWAALSEPDFRRMVRAFLNRHYPAHLRHLSHRARWSEMREWYLTLSRQGWVAPAWPPSHGGMGLPPDKLIAWIEELEHHGVARAPDQGIVMIGPLLIQHGTPEQQQRFLPHILSGAHIWCQGYSEPNAGSDLAGLRTEAVLSRDDRGEHFVVNGQKIWTTLAQDANHIFLLVRTDKLAKKQEGISFLLCELGTPGITIRPIRTLAGEEEFCEVFFDNVRVPADNLVGPLHGGWTIAKALLGFERIFLGSPKQCQYALAQLTRLAHAKPLFCDPVFVQRYTALQLDVADLSAVYGGFADTVKAGKPLPPSVSLLKVWASETYHRIGALLAEYAEEQAIIVGDLALNGQPFNALSPLIGSTSAMIYGGTNEIQRNILARQVLELPT